MVALGVVVLLVVVPLVVGIVAAVPLVVPLGMALGAVVVVPGLLVAGLLVLSSPVLSAPLLSSPVSLLSELLLLVPLPSGSLLSALESLPLLTFSLPSVTVVETTSDRRCLPPAVVRVGGGSMNPAVAERERSGGATAIPLVSSTCSVLQVK